MEPTEWAAHLGPDEPLLWHGKPGNGIRFYPDGWGRLAIGAGFTALALGLHYTLNAGRFDISAVSLLILALLLFGLFWLLLDWFVDAFIRSRTSYALTDKHALIHVRVPGAKMQAYPITIGNRARLSRVNSSVFFASKTVQTRSKTAVKIGFHHLRDADLVYAILAGRPLPLE